MRALAAIAGMCLFAANARADHEFACPTTLEGDPLIRGEVWVDETLSWFGERKSVSAATVNVLAIHPVEARYLEMGCVYENGSNSEYLLPATVLHCESWNRRHEESNLEFICTEDPGGTRRLPSWWPTESPRGF